jgi:hypothetical protein
MPIGAAMRNGLPTISQGPGDPPTFTATLKKSNARPQFDSAARVWPLWWHGDGSRNSLAELGNQSLYISYV